MELFLIYLWLKLDAIIELSTGISVITGIVAACLLALRAIEGDKLPDRMKKASSKLNIVFVTALLIALFTPSSKNVAILVGSSIAIDIARSPEGAKIATLLRGKANELLDEELKKLTPQKK